MHAILESLDRKRSYDKENSNGSMKCTRWSLGGDVGTNPPLLADMGLSLLQDEESTGGPTPTPPTTEVKADNPPPPKVAIHLMLFQPSVFAGSFDHLEIMSLILCNLHHKLACFSNSCSLIECK